MRLHKETRIEVTLTLTEYDVLCRLVREAQQAEWDAGRHSGSQDRGADPASIADAFCGKHPEWGLWEPEIREDQAAGEAPQDADDRAMVLSDDDPQVDAPSRRPRTLLRRVIGQ
jgi:hypothetical protein